MWSRAAFTATRAGINAAARPKTIPSPASLASRRTFSSLPPRGPVGGETYPPTHATPSSVRQKNLLTAAFCSSFVFFVWYYSVNAVKKSTLDENGEDELDRMEKERMIHVHQSGELKVHESKK
ncbi:hypothetical protein TrVE_jg10134 [Triparma verrucosa]|uniref:Uncharacterized protein n=2 Tax=Triparma TaxID=722752 RepID=A0A9W6ZKM1_9STRA|nr:hypothetical protein TrST_g3037 [Triparma strigata]GMH96441.1 hypothetical protein TrVE_jg10134 [Triparma verrucosa]